MISVCLVGLLISFLYVPTINGYTVTLANKDEVNLITQWVTEPFFVADCAFKSDIFISNDEFRYLTDIKSGHEISGQQLMRAVTFLFQKNCFKSIVLSIENDLFGKKIFFTLTGLWRFDSLKIKGIWVGKDWYKQYYLMEPGDPFDMDKHRHSMQKITEACKKDGFFDVSTQSVFEQNQKTKSVSVCTTINRGNRFSINEIALSLQADETLSYKEISTLKRYLHKKFLRSNQMKKYSRNVLEQQAKAIKKYLTQRGFLLVNIDLTETLMRDNKMVNLTWYITLGKKRNFVFFGARFFSHKQLLNRLLQFGRSAWIVPASILADELRQMYRAKGFWNVHIEATDEADRAIFVITQAERAIIADIAVKGVTVVPDKRIIKQCFKKVKRHNFFDQQLFDDACEQLIDLCLTHGLLDAKIVQHEYVPLGAGRYQLVITVSEGDQIVINDIAIPGYERLLQKGPFLGFKKKKTICYDAHIIQTQKRWLIDHFHNNGYLFVGVESKLVDSTDNKKKLVWDITPGNQICFGKTIIQGSSTLPFAAIMRELRYKESDIWNGQKIRHSFKRLRDMHIFDAVSFAPLIIKEDDHSDRPIMLKFHKDDPFELRVRSGLEFQHIRQYQTFGGLTYKIGGTFLVKNPANNGDYFQFNGDAAQSHRELHFTYFYPWLFTLPVVGRLEAYGFRYEQPGFIGTKKNIYTIFRNGFLGGLQHKTPYIDVGVNIGFEVGRTKVADDIAMQELASSLACAIDFNQRLLNKRIPFFFIEPTILINHLDNNLNPTKGMSTLINLKGMFPTSSTYADSYFVKLLVEHSWFAPIAQAVVAFRIRFGHIFHRCFSDIMPNERFYLGGSHSVRSYETDLAPPLGCFEDAKGKNIVPRGGKTMFNLNVELRLPPLKKMGFVIFQDLGILCGDNFSDFTSRNIVSGSGFGVRYFTPIGPLRFDIAWKWKREFSKEHPFNWFVTLGQAF